MLPESKAFTFENIDGHLVISLKNEAVHLGQGAYGLYYDLLNGWGVKMFHRTRSDAISYTIAQKKDESEGSHNMELSFLKKVREAYGDLAPDFKPELFIVKQGMYYYVAIATERIDGERAGNVVSTTTTSQAMQNYMQLKLANIGVKWTDDNSSNWMIGVDGRIVIVDFGNMTKMNEQQTAESKSFYSKELNKSHRRLMLETRALEMLDQKILSMRQEAIL